MYSGAGTRALPRVGFPIRKSRDQRLVSTYPGLIAAAHVLPRLLAPRHPPCALSLLIYEEHLLCEPLWSFQGARGPASAELMRRPPGGGLSKLSSVTSCRGRRSSRRARTPDGLVTRVHHGPGAHRSNRSGIPRKEVIQPQLPLRLPCYDFTPITDPTFDGSLPCGLGHRLRVLPAFVV